MNFLSENEMTGHRLRYLRPDYTFILRDRPESQTFRHINVISRYLAGAHAYIENFRMTSPGIRFYLRDEQLRSVFPLWDPIREVEKMQFVEDNWNGYGSEAPNQLARDIAEMVLLAAGKEIPVPKVLKSAQGGIAIYFISDEKRADIECLNTGEIIGTKAKDGSYLKVWEIKPTEIPAEISSIKDFLGQ